MWTPQPFNIFTGTISGTSIFLLYCASYLVCEFPSLIIVSLQDVQCLPVSGNISFTSTYKHAQGPYTWAARADSTATQSVPVDQQHPALHGSAFEMQPQLTPHLVDQSLWVGTQDLCFSMFSWWLSGSHVWEALSVLPVPASYHSGPLSSVPSHSIPHGSVQAFSFLEPYSFFKWSQPPEGRFGWLFKRRYAEIWDYSIRASSLSPRMSSCFLDLSAKMLHTILHSVSKMNPIISSCTPSVSTSTIWAVGQHCHPRKSPSAPQHPASSVSKYDSASTTAPVWVLSTLVFPNRFILLAATSSPPWLNSSPKALLFIW